MCLLTLHRRAHSYALKGDRKSAYNDYYKLQRHIREVRRHVREGPLHIVGAHDFLACLEARANQNIGELYRAEHAQQPALKHFETALACLQRIDRKGEMDAVLTNSRWYVELQISRGKASYEMGRHKEALRWHLGGWRAFLALLADATQTEAEVKEIDKAIKWLDAIKLEPELRKDELQAHLQPVIDQLGRIQVDERYGALAAEILLRLGHVLLVLRLGLTESLPLNPTPGECHERFAETLSFPCLRKAAECNPRSTLAAADLLKARLRIAGWVREAGSPNPQCEAELALPEIAAVREQITRGSDDYERLVRVAEYLTLVSLDPDTAPRWDQEPTDRKDEIMLARGLLLDVFMHTDSINVRKAQTHRYMMRPRAPADPPKDVPRSGIALPVDSGSEGSRACDELEKRGEPAIELVCMRRYSSAFPLLPRPSAFRAHGGGYFVRLHPRWRREGGEGRRTTADSRGETAEQDGAAGVETQQSRPIGIVVDPGPDFVENLYRTGFSLSDIDVIVVTHDHVDHLNSLEPLLSLLHYRDDLLARQGDELERPPIVYGNRSILERYEKVRQLNQKRRFKSRKEIGTDPHLAERGFEGFEIETISSRKVDEAGRGHTDLSEKASYGICFRHRDPELTLAITSDTPAPPLDEGEQAAYRRWVEHWRGALNADVLVAHVSTVPLAELRQVARLDARLSISARWMRDLNRQIGELEEHVDLLLARTERDLARRRFASSEIELASRCVREVQEPLRELNGAIERLKSTFSALTRDSEAWDPHPIADDPPPRIERAIEEVEAAGKTLLACSKAMREAVSALGQEHVLRDECSRLALETRCLAQVAQAPRSEAEKLEEIRAELEDVDGNLRGRIEFSMWLRSREPGPTADLAGRVGSGPDPKDRWLPPRDHPYLRGTLAWARAYRETRKESGAADGLLVLGELSEELGTARGKIAGQINDTLFKQSGLRAFSALTSDVGLGIFVVPAGEGAAGKPQPAGEDDERAEAEGRRGVARILCTTCQLDTDRVPDERYHSAECIREVCVKGENEGIFYNCHHHDPATDRRFLEQLERFDVFGR